MLSLICVMQDCCSVVQHPTLPLDPLPTETPILKGAQSRNDILRWRGKVPGRDLWQQWEAGISYDVVLLFLAPLHI
jgi:hypothetical protein